MAEVSFPFLVSPANAIEKGPLQAGMFPRRDSMKGMCIIDARAIDERETERDDAPSYPYNSSNYLFRDT